MPIVICLLAGLGIYAFYCFSPYTRWEGALLLLGILPIFSHANPHVGTWAKEAYTCSLLLGISSYWIPTLILLTPVIFVVIARFRLVTPQALMAVLMGYTTVAIYAALLIYLGWCDNPWRTFFDAAWLWGWIPVLIITVAITGIIIVRRVLKDRWR